MRAGAATLVVAQARAEAERAFTEPAASGTPSLPYKGKPNYGCGALTLTETMESEGSGAPGP